MLQNPFDIEGKIVIVTGGLGQLGRQFSRSLAGEGARVAVFDCAGTSNISDNSHLKFFKIDITKKSSIQSGLNKILSAWGTPHALINNAGVDAPPHAATGGNGPFETYSEKAWAKVLDVNLKGAFLCSQVIGSEMAKAGRGSIVNISSIYGMVSPDQRLYEHRRKKGEPFYKPVAYSVSKSGLLNLTRYLATYWAGKHVRVNTLTLGGVWNGQDSKFLKKYSAKAPMGRMAREDEYNGAVQFLVSDASSYMTGSNLVIDGGWTSW